MKRALWKIKKYTLADRFRLLSEEFDCTLDNFFLNLRIDSLERCIFISFKTKMNSKKFIFVNNFANCSFAFQ